MKGWVITKQHFDYDDGLPSRVGWGQVDEDIVHEDSAQIFARQISLETDLDPKEIEDPVHWRTMSDDGIEEGLSYSGVISRDWLDGEEDLAFGPVTFATTDVGDTIMEYYKPGCKCMDGKHTGHTPGTWEVL